jgi:hypothetical protein
VVNSISFQLKVTFGIEVGATVGIGVGIVVATGLLLHLDVVGHWYLHAGDIQ